MQLRKQINQDRREYDNADIATMHRDHCAVTEACNILQGTRQQTRSVADAVKQTSRISDRTDLHEMPAVEAPYFYPAQDGGHQRCPYSYPAQDGGRPMTRKTTKSRGHGQRARRRTETLNNHHTPGLARASRRETEDEDSPRIANATGSEEQPDCDAPPPASSNGHPDCAKVTVHKTHGVTVHEGEPACDTQKERRQEKTNLSKPEHSRTKAAAVLQTNEREPRICTPPGTAATTNNGATKQIQRAPYLYPARDGGKPA